MTLLDHLVPPDGETDLDSRILQEYGRVILESSPEAITVLNRDESPSRERWACGQAAGGKARRSGAFLEKAAVRLGRRVQSRATGVV